MRVLSHLVTLWLLRNFAHCHELDTDVDTCSVVLVVMEKACLVEFVIMSDEFEVNQLESIFCFHHVMVVIQ